MEQIDILENIFANQISVMNIAIPVIHVGSKEVKNICEVNNFDIHLVRDGQDEELKIYERVTDQFRHLRDSEVISESTPIMEAIQLLLKYPQLFIKEKTKITSIVSKADLDSIPVRIWLFGMLNIFEMHLRNRIETNKIEWEMCLSQERLDKAQGLYAMKKTRNEEVNLLSCVQLCDLGKVVQKKQPFFLEAMVKKKIEKTFNRINELRDQLAHAQKLTMDWAEIYDLISFIKGMMNTSTK